MIYFILEQEGEYRNYDLMMFFVVQKFVEEKWGISLIFEKKIYIVDYVKIIVRKVFEGQIKIKDGKEFF